MRRWAAPILRMMPVSSSLTISSDAYRRSSCVGLRNCADCSCDSPALRFASASLGGNGSGMTASSLMTDSSIGPPAFVRLCIHSPCGTSSPGSPPAAATAWNSVRNTGVMKLDKVRLANIVGSTANGTWISVAMNCCSQMNTASSMR